MVIGDTGSDVSLVHEKFMKKLKVKPCKKVDLVLDGVGVIHQKTNVYKLSINGNKIEVFGVKHLPKANQKEFSDGNVKIPALENRQIGLVIGNNHYGLIHPRETIHGEEDLMYINTKIGWFAYRGGINEKVAANCNIAIKCPLAKENKLSVEDERLAEKFEKEFKIEDGQICAPMLIEEDDGQELKELCPRRVAENRLLQQLRGFQKNSFLEEQYDEKMYEYMNDGIAIEKPNNLEIVNFIPHHSVNTSNKKFRVVFACNYSLSGEDSINVKSVTGLRLLNNNIREILMKIRLGKYLMTADIRAMFRQIHLIKEHWKYCGFLYWPKGVIKTKSNL